MLTDAAFNDIRRMIKRTVVRTQYRVGSTWYDSTLLDTVITGDGIVRVKTQIAHGSPCTINRVRLISCSGDVWAEKAINVILENSYTHLLQWFDFTISESEVN